MSYLGRGWWDLSGDWPRLEDAARNRDTQKARYRSTKNWSATSTHFVGLLGEMVFSFETGIEIDLELRSCGDGGRDFIYDHATYDVKGSVYYNDPHLKQYPNPKKWSDVYILAAIDIGTKRAIMAGWALRCHVENAPLVDYGHGPQRSISASDMRPGMPHWLPSKRPST